MNIETIQDGNRVRIVLNGVLDEKGAEELKSRIKQLNLGQVTEVTIDCQQVKHIGSSGIGKILLLYKHLTTNGGNLTVSGLSTPLYELFTELKMDTLFSVSKAA